MDQADRKEYLKYDAGIGYCNINKCCTDVCPEHIKITDNAIIPLKERVADDYYDPVRALWRKLKGERSGDGGSDTGHAEHIAVSDEAAALDSAARDGAVGSAATPGSVGTDA
jgi:hypothetical protein